MNGVGKSRLEFDLSRPPSLVEPRLQRAIKAQDGVPALAGDGLHPVLLLAGRGFGTEIDIDRPVGVNQESLGLAADARELLIGLDVTG